MVEGIEEKCLMSFYIEIENVIKHEGGYVNDPSDPGGETKYGISKKAYPKVDIKNLTLDDAIEIYKDDYWLPAKVERLPDKLQGQYFDMVVNQGIAKSAKILQRACNGKNKDKIQVDGKVGPNTIKAADRLEPDRLRAYRIMEYARLALAKPELEKYYYGWVKRAMHA
jgi:lysozyme family protein